MTKIKNTIASLLYRLLVIIAKLTPAKKGIKHLLLIKPDEIGDYILFRNLLVTIRSAEKYKDYKITLVGNVAWKSIFDKYDADTVDESIWITKKKFNKDLKYRLSILKQIRQLQTSEVINCIYSRSIILDDGFAYVATGCKKFATERDNANAGKYSIDIDRYIYTNIVSAGNERIFDSIRNSRFIGTILGTQELSINTKLPHKKAEYEMPADKYILFSLGAGNPERKWGIDNFVKCAKYANERYGLIPLLCGGNTEESDAMVFIDGYKDRVYNYVNKTSLPQFIELLSNASIAVSVDSGPVHIAAATGCSTIGLYSGKYYKRYAPYPKEIAQDFYPVYPDFVDSLIAVNDERLYDPFKMKNDTIKLIPAEKVVPYIDKIMTFK